MRVFLDTNVLVSAFATRGLCADVFRLVLASHELVVGQVVLEELEGVLRKKVGLPEGALQELLEFPREHTIIEKPEKTDLEVVADPADAWVLASAVAAKADYLVTGDSDLLEISEEVDLEIVTPRELWERLRRH